MPKNNFKVGDEVVRFDTYNVGKTEIALLKIMGIYEGMRIGHKGIVKYLPGMKKYEERNCMMGERGMIIEDKNGREWVMHQHHYKLAKTSHGKNTKAKKGKGSKSA